MNFGYRRLLPQRWRGWIRSLMVECGTQGCRRFHLAHAWLRRPPGILLDQTWYCSPACFRDAVKTRIEALLSAAITDLRQPPRMPYRLILVATGKVTQEQLAQARSLHAGWAASASAPVTEDVGDALVRLGYATEETVAAARAAEAGCVFFASALQPMAPVHRLPLWLLETHRAVPVHYTPMTNRLLVGFVYRIDNGLLRAVEQVTGCRVEGCMLTRQAWADQVASCRATASPEVHKRAVQQSRIVNLIVDQAIESHADAVRLGMTGTASWARLTEGPQVQDLVIALAEAGAEDRGGAGGVRALAAQAAR